MTRPKIVDTFLFHDELDMLFCRLFEIGDIVDHIVIVEATTTFRGDPKPLWFAEHRSRFAFWADRIVHVVVDDLPDATSEPDPWQREYTQRRRTLAAVAGLGLAAHDIVLHGDVDEIPRRFHLRNVRPTGLTPFGMRFHPFAVDWLHPHRWHGTVAATWATVQTLGESAMLTMRLARDTVPCPSHMADAGWHFSWVGGNDYARRKLVSFSHHEIVDRVQGELVDDMFWRDGWHVDGTKLTPVDVDNTWPLWVTDRSCPDVWFRPRIEVP